MKNNLCLSFQNEKFEKEYFEQRYLQYRKPLLLLYGSTFVLTLIGSIILFIFEKEYEHKFLSQNSLFRLFFLCFFALFPPYIYILFSKKFNKAFHFFELYAFTLLCFIQNLGFYYLLEKKLFKELYFMGIIAHSALGYIFKFLDIKFILFKQLIFLIINGFFFLNINRDLVGILFYYSVFSVTSVESFEIYKNESIGRENFINEKYNKSNANLMTELFYQLYPGSTILLSTKINNLDK